LVYNPVGTFLPAAQATLEAEYKHELQEKFGIVFNNLFTITNMPIHRFKESLQRSGGYEDYMDKLVNAFNPAAAAGVMCRSLISVGYDGKLYDCDFNQMLEMQVVTGTNGSSRVRTIFDFDMNELTARNILFDAHCFGCTAGAGSSCGGTTA
jgi:radical SAM/Cys-rich protein